MQSSGEAVHEEDKQSTVSTRTGGEEGKKEEMSEIK